MNKSAYNNKNNALITFAVESLSYNHPDMYVNKFGFIIGKDINHYIRKDNEWIITPTRIFSDISINTKSNLEFLGVFRHVFPANKNTTSIDIIAENEIIKIPLIEKTFYGLKEVGYGFKNSTHYYVDENNLVLRIPKRIAIDAYPEYHEHIITINNPDNP